MIANKLIAGPRMPGIYQGPQLSSKPGVFVSCDADRRECRIPPVVRRQRRSPIASTYDADNPATAMDTMLLKAVDDPRIMSERRVDIMVVATIVGTGIDVRGLTCEAQTVRSEHVHIELTVVLTATSSFYLYESTVAWQASIACKRPGHPRARGQQANVGKELHDGNDTSHYRCSGK